MSTLSTVPGTVDVSGYAGDTLTIAVTAPDALVSGRVWSAQIRSANDAATVDATFTVTPPVTIGGPAYLTLDPEDTARLVGASELRVRSTVDPRALTAIYRGVWDVEVRHPSGKPATTLARGKLTIELDVTRAGA